MSSVMPCTVGRVFFFFNDTATTEIYTLSLHDALPISTVDEVGESGRILIRFPIPAEALGFVANQTFGAIDLSLTNEAEYREIGRAQRLNSSHANISYAVFCLKKKKHTTMHFKYEHSLH